MQAARDRQKSYADVRRKPLEFQVGDRVMLKVSPWKGVVRFGKRGKLNPSNRWKSGCVRSMKLRRSQYSYSSRFDGTPIEARFHVECEDQFPRKLDWGLHLVFIILLDSYKVAFICRDCYLRCTFERQQHKTNATWRPRILWKNLTEHLVKTFRAAIYEKICALVEDTSASDACQMWNTLSRIIKDTVKESAGVTSETTRTHSTHMESWWFSKEVQPKVAAKQSKFKKILSCREGNHEDIVKVKERYKLDKREAKIVVALAKDKAYEDLYKKLDSKEGENDISRIANALKRRSTNFRNKRETQRKGEVENSSQHPQFSYYYARINQREVRVALQKMWRNKAVGQNGNSHRSLRCLGICRVLQASALQVFRRLGSIFTSVYAADQKLKKAYVYNLEKDAYVKRNKAISLEMTTSKVGIEVQQLFLKGLYLVL
ncbi:hypothetical protein Tco_0867011 [Tanacetum coccineum]